MFFSARTPAMPDSLDMSLDDLVQGSSKKGSGRGKGGGKSWNTWGNKAEGGGRGQGSGKKKEAAEQKAGKADGDKIDMTLDEVIEKDGKGGRKGKGWKEEGKGKSKGKNDTEKSKGKGKGKGNSDWYSGGGDKWSNGGYGSDKGWSKGDSWSSKGDSWSSKGSSKGKGGDSWSKGSSKGASSWGGGSSYGGGYGGKGSYSKGAGAPSWNEHDDRDDEDDWKGSGKGGRGGSWDGPVGGSRPARVDRGGDDGWQRVPDRAPIRDDPRRDSWRDELPARRARSPERPTRKREAAEPRGAPAKRAREEPADSRTKNIKVTGIPRDVNMQDIKDAFEAETGKIARCRLDRGSAWIAFTRASDARKAIETFDRGELNGATIGVALDP